MLKRVLGGVATLTVRYSIIVILVCLLFTIIAANGITLLSTESNMEKWMPQDMMFVQTGKLIRSEFGGSDLGVVLVKVVPSDDPQAVQDIRDPLVLEAIERLEQRLITEEHVYRVFSIVDAVKAAFGEIPRDEELLHEFLSDESFRDLISKDFGATIVMFWTDAGVSDVAASELQRCVEEDISQASFPSGVEVYLTGLPSMIHEISKLINEVNKQTSTVSLLFIFIILVSAYLSVRLGILQLLPMVFGVSWTLGSMGYLGIPLNIVTATVSSLTLGVGIGYAIHILGRYVEERERGLNVEDAIHISLTETGAALTAAMGTTLAGFAAMLAGSSPIVRQLGASLSFGLIYSFLAAIILLPSVIYVLERRGSLVKGAEVKGAVKLAERLLYTLGGFEARRPYVIAVLLIALTLASFYGMSMLKIEESYERMMPSDLPVIQAYHKVEDEFGGIDTMMILVEAEDVRDPEVLKAMDALQKRIATEKWVVEVTSPVDAVKRVYGYIPSSKEDVAAVLNLGSADVSEDFRYALITARLSYPRSRERDIDISERFLEAMSAVPLPEGVELRIYGDPYGMYEMEPLRQENLRRISTIGVTLVALIAVFYFKSPFKGLLSLTPVVLATLWTFGMMGLAGIPFGMHMTGVIAMTAGLGIDFGIHITHRYGEELRRSPDVSTAVQRAVAGVGRELWAAAAATIAGFLALLSARIPMIGDLGIVLATAIFFCFFAAVVFVPTVLVFTERRKREKEVVRK